MSITNDIRAIVWNERPIVRVEGMVMVRGDLGFTAYLGYEHSRVAIYESVTRTDYLIYGYKIKDKSVVTLNALIPPQMPFTKATPIFHYWQIADQRMGLTFNGTADARSFDRGIRVALENLEKAASANTSSSEDASSASPTSTESFNLSCFDDSSAPDTQPIFTKHLPTPHPCAKKAQAFRPHAMSASSSRGPPVPQSCPQRRHSSSVPGRPHRVRAPSESTATHMTVVAISTLPSSGTTTTTSGANALLATVSCIEEPSKASSSSSVSDLVRPPPTFARRQKSRARSESASTSQHRARRTKTPNLDNLERQRDLKPTKPNSYVQIASSGAGAGEGVGASAFLRSNSRTSEGVHLAYSTTRFLAQRSAMHEYRYRGLTASDDSHCDFSTAPLNPVSYAGSLKQPSNRGGDYKRSSAREKEDLGERSWCRNCQVMFNHERNVPGSCPEAPPDNVRKAIDRVSCLCVPSCLFYCCARDFEGNYEQEPCSCARHHGGPSRKRRWVALGFLSLLFPCLCLYPFLMSCYKCGVACHCCGGKHVAMPTKPKNGDSPVKKA